MLISLDNLSKKYEMFAKGVLHVGAHKVEERTTYASVGIKRVLWIEANPCWPPGLWNFSNANLSDLW
jgi:hypothetical protein